MTLSRFSNKMGMVVASSILGIFPVLAQDGGDFLEIKVTLSATNIIRTVPAVSVFCEVQSSIVSGNGNIGEGQTALYFGGDPDDLLTFDPRQDDFKFTQVIAADREALPSQITVKVLPTGNTPLDAWTKGNCSFGLFDPEELESEFFTPSAYWQLRAYADARGCEEVNPNILFSCINPNMFIDADGTPDTNPRFVRPGYEDE